MTGELQRLIEGGATLVQEVSIYGSVQLTVNRGEGGPEFIVSYASPGKGGRRGSRYRGPVFADALAAFAELARLEAVMAYLQ